MTDWTGTSLEGIGPRCRRCKELLVRPTRDPCLKALDDPHIVTCCCGHQRPDLATVCFDDGRQPLHGEDAIRYFAEAGCGPYGDPEQRMRNTA